MHGPSRYVCTTVLPETEVGRDYIGDLDLFLWFMVCVLVSVAVVIVRVFVFACVN